MGKNKEPNTPPQGTRRFSHPFVGRQDELRRFRDLLPDPQGRAVLVSGQAAMGKTMLLNKMLQIAENHPDLKCTCLRYEVTPDQPPETVMLDILTDTADVLCSLAGGVKKFLNANKEKIKALFSVGGLLTPVVGQNVKELGNLITSLAEDAKQKGNARRRLTELLQIISERLPDHGRFVVFVDPEKVLHPQCADAWRLVISGLPDKLLFVFAQRPEDALITNTDFCGLDCVDKIPSEQLDVFSQAEYEELLDSRKGQLTGIVSETQLRTTLARYKGHPHALQAAMDLLIQKVPPEELPDRPEPVQFAVVQTREIGKISPQALQLFRAYAVLEIACPDSIVRQTANLTAEQMDHLLSHPFLHTLLRPESSGRRIYHIILADQITKKAGKDCMKPYHSRAAGAYRTQLHKAQEIQTPPDPIALERLPQHILQAEGPDVFIDCFINECQDLLIRIGLLDLHIRLSKQALEYAKDDSVDQACLYGNLGVVYRTRGDLDGAEAMYKKSLAIEEKLGRLEGMASDYGNLGNVYYTRGDLDGAEAMYKKALQIDEKLGRLEGMASDYGNLGIVYKTRGDLDGAEAMYKKSLAIEEKLGRLEGMASDYGNLGLLYEKRGQNQKALEHWHKAKELYQRLGAQHMADKMRQWIDSIEKEP